MAIFREVQEGEEGEEITSTSRVSKSLQESSRVLLVFLMYLIDVQAAVCVVAGVDLDKPAQQGQVYSAVTFNSNHYVTKPASYFR